MSSSVVLPAPLGPTRPVTAPLGTDMSSWRTAGARPKKRVSWETSMLIRPGYVVGAGPVAEPGPPHFDQNFKIDAAPGRF